MYLFPYSMLLFSLISLCAFPLPACAMPAITCHCFTERVYDASRPAAADAYFLAAVQNTFFAIVFDTDKKSIVMKKQQVCSADDLWIAHWIAAQTGKNPDTLLQSRSRGDSWKQVATALRIPPKAAGTRFMSVLNAHGPVGQLSEAVVDAIIVKEQLVGEQELADVRRVGATNQELIIAILVGAGSGQPVRRVYQTVKSGTSTWGALLTSARIDVNRLQYEMVRILKIRHI